MQKQKEVHMYYMCTISNGSISKKKDGIITFRQYRQNILIIRWRH